MVDGVILPALMDNTMRNMSGKNDVLIVSTHTLSYVLLDIIFCAPAHA
jgi:hypothetical protein